MYPFWTLQVRRDANAQPKQKLNVPAWNSKPMRKRKLVIKRNLWEESKAFFLMPVRLKDLTATQFSFSLGWLSAAVFFFFSFFCLCCLALAVVILSGSKKQSVDAKVQLNVVEMWVFKEHCQIFVAHRRENVSRGVGCATFPYWSSSSFFHSECWLSPSSFIFLKFFSSCRLKCIHQYQCSGCIVCVCVCVLASSFFRAHFLQNSFARTPPLRALAASATDGCRSAKSALHTVRPLGRLQVCSWDIQFNPNQSKMFFFMVGGARG